MTDKLTDLLQKIEQQGFADERGHLLTNCVQWHQLRLAARLIEERTGPAVGGAVERAVQDVTAEFWPGASELTPEEIVKGAKI